MLVVFLCGENHVPQNRSRGNRKRGRKNTRQRWWHRKYKKGGCRYHPIWITKEGEGIIEETGKGTCRIICLSKNKTKNNPVT